MTMYATPSAVTSFVVLIRCETLELHVIDIFLLIIKCKKLFTLHLAIATMYEVKIHVLGKNENGINFYI